MYKRGKKAAMTGVTLVETLVALALLGVVMIPVLFASSAFFTSRLAGVRDRLGVSHDVSVFLNRFMEEIHYTHLLLKTSDADELHFAYIDPITQESVWGGYKLEAPADGAGNLVLKRLHYNGGAWVETTPYAVVDPQEIRLPSNAAFKYCDEPTCATPVVAEKALFVRLENFSFASPGGGYDLNMPTTLDVYLAGGTTGGVVLSESARALYSFDGSDNYGADADLNRLSLSSDGRRLNYLEIITGGSGTLSVIATGTNMGRDHSVMATSGGRVFFGNATRFWTWKEGAGLTTIIANGSSPGGNNINEDTYDHYVPTMVVDSNDGVLFAEYDGSNKVFYWREGTGLTTVLNSSVWGGTQSMTVDSQDRFYFGECDANNSNRFRTWKPGSSVTQLAQRNCIGFTSTQPFPGGGVVFGNDANSSRLLRWTESDGLSTIMANGHALGIHNLQVGSNGRVYFGTDYYDDGISDYFWTWKSDTGLTTIARGNSNTQLLGRRSTHVSADGEMVFLGQEKYSNGRFRVWENTGGSGTLTTITGNMDYPGGFSSSLVAPDGRVFFGEQEANKSLYTWKKGAGLSVLANGLNWPGERNLLGYANAAQRLFFTTSSNGTNNNPVLSWHETDGLTTILKISADSWGERRLQVTSDGRVFFGNFSATGSYWTWHKDTGLTTILSSGGRPGWHGSFAYSEGAQRHFFGTTSNFYTWTTTPPLLKLRLNSNLGTLSGNSLSITPNSYAYTFGTQDSSGDLYYMDTTAKKMDHYRYNSATSNYSLLNSLDWSGNAATVKGISVDNTGMSMALLDAGNTEIDVYANRYSSGVTAPSATLNLAADNDNPTGLAFSDRTGNYLVIDSDQTSNTIRLFVYSNAGTLLHTIDISLTASNLGVAATAETSFKIAYDSRRNLLYLIAPTIDRVYALSLPKFI